MNDQSKPAKKAQIPKLDPEVLASYAKEFGSSLIRNFMHKGAQKATAESLAQNVFVRLAQRSSGGEIQNPKGYLMQTASSVWNDHLRKRYRRKHTDHIEYEEHAHAPVDFSAQRVLEGKQALQRIVDVLNELPERTRQIYALCRIEGLKRRDVAKRLGVSESSVYQHLVIATARIGSAFGER